MDNCLFCKILRGDIDCNKVYEDEFVFAFEDNNPQAPIHILIIPKKHITNINAADDEFLMGKLILVAKNIALKENFADDGYRLIINCGDNGGQEIPHIHLHLLAGRKFIWPPG